MVGPGSGENQPLKLAGYALLAVAAIAAIVGLITLASGGSEAAQPDPAIQSAPSSSSETPPPPAPATPTAAAPAPSVGPAPAPPAGAPGPNQFASPSSSPTALPGAGLPSDDTTGSTRSRSAAKAPIRVYNNSLINGLADRAADDMRDSGWTVTEVSNWSSGNIPTSTVYYRTGTSEQAAARNLASSFGLRAEPRFSGIADASPGLIVIVTKDFQRR